MTTSDAALPEAMFARFADLHTGRAIAWNTGDTCWKVQFGAIWPISGRSDADGETPTALALSDFEKSLETFYPCGVPSNNPVRGPMMRIRTLSFFILSEISVWIWKRERSNSNHGTPHGLTSGRLFPKSLLSNSSKGLFIGRLLPIEVSRNYASKLKKLLKILPRSFFGKKCKNCKISFMFDPVKSQMALIFFKTAVVGPKGHRLKTIDLFLRIKTQVNIELDLRKSERSIRIHWQMP